MPKDDLETLVSTQWLAGHLADPDLRVLDGSFYLPDMKRDARADYAAGHIPGARFFDIDDVADHRSELPHTAPPAEKFAKCMREMGVGDGHRVVVYDGAGLFSSARVWWTFRLMGKTNVAVLDGGFPKWKAEGHPIESLPPVIRDRRMTVSRQKHLIRDITQVAAAAKLRDHVIIDARSPGRFRGDEVEPRPGLRAGHIPNSHNIHYRTLLNEDGTMKDADVLRTIFEKAGADLSKPAITTCGSGVTAAILNLALERMGHPDHALYDGSWAEWGMHGGLDVATGDT